MISPVANMSTTATFDSLTLKFENFNFGGFSGFISQINSCSTFQRALKKRKYYLTLSLYFIKRLDPRRFLAMLGIQLMIKQKAVLLAFI